MTPPVPLSPEDALWRFDAWISEWSAKHDNCYRGDCCQAITEIREELQKRAAHVRRQEKGDGQ